MRPNGFSPENSRLVVDSSQARGAAGAAGSDEGPVAALPPVTHWRAINHFYDALKCGVVVVNMSV